MPIIKSAKKRVRQIEKATIRNAKTKRTLRETMKAFHKALAEGKADEVAKTHAAVNSAIDIAAKKNLIHKNKAARRKASVNAQAKAIASGNKDAKKALTQPIAAVKKTGAKKAAAKKAVVKKAVAAKTGAKKPAATKKPANKK